MFSSISVPDNMMLERHLFFIFTQPGVWKVSAGVDVVLKAAFATVAAVKASPHLHLLQPEKIDLNYKGALGAILPGEKISPQVPQVRIGSLLQQRHCSHS